MTTPSREASVISGSCFLYSTYHFPLVIMGLLVYYLPSPLRGKFHQGICLSYSLLYSQHLKLPSDEAALGIFE